MKRIAILALLAVAATAAVAQARGHGTTCGQRAGGTLLADRHLRVFVTTARGRGDDRTFRVFACSPNATSAGRALITFGSTIDDGWSIEDAALGGRRWLVLESTEETGTSGYLHVDVFDLQLRKEVAITQREGGTSGPLVATRDGGFAVLGEEGDVTVADAAGARQLVEEKASDLAAAGNTVYWTVAGKPQSATLVGMPKGKVGLPG